MPIWSGGLALQLRLNSSLVLARAYLLRRAVCNLTTKSYNRTFIGLGRFLQEIYKSTDPERKGSVVENIKKYLSGLAGDSAEWPKDEKFFEAWRSNPTYQTLDNSKLVYILRRLSNCYLTNKNESIGSPLTIEHILPQDWLENWLLQDGSKGMTFEEALASEEGNSVAEATIRRYSMLQTLGNLTILTQPLNSAVSNSAWKDKKPQLLQSSLLPIKQQLVTYEKWDEETIERRGKELFARALLVWPAPSRNPETH